MEELGPFPIHLLAENCGVNWSMKCFIISAVILALVLGVRCGKSVEEEVVGTYEAKDRGDTYGVVFLDNGVIETYNNGQRDSEELKWNIVSKEVNVKYTDNDVGVFRINPDRSLTAIAQVKEGKRKDISRKLQLTYIKIE